MNFSLWITWSICIGVSVLLFLVLGLIANLRVGVELKKGQKLRRDYITQKKINLYIIQEEYTLYLFHYTINCKEQMQCMLFCISQVSLLLRCHYLVFVRWSAPSIHAQVFHRKTFTLVYTLLPLPFQPLSPFMFQFLSN